MGGPPNHRSVMCVSLSYLFSMNLCIAEHSHEKMLKQNASYFKENFYTFRHLGYKASLCGFILIIS